MKKYVTITYETNIGLFAGFGSITLRAGAGKSEVYWK